MQTMRMRAIQSLKTLAFRKARTFADCPKGCKWHDGVSQIQLCEWLYGTLKLKCRNCGFKWDYSDEALKAAVNKIVAATPTGNVSANE